MAEAAKRGPGRPPNPENADKPKKPSVPTITLPLTGKVGESFEKAQAHLESRNPGVGFTKRQTMEFILGLGVQALDDL